MHAVKELQKWHAAYRGRKALFTLLNSDFIIN